MVLWVAEQWEQFFTSAGIPSAESKTNAAFFVTNHITEAMLPVLLKDYLISFGVTIIGNILPIIQHTKGLPQPCSEAASTTITSSAPTMPSESINKWPPFRQPHVTLGMINQQFQISKFKINWGLFKQLTTIPNCCAVIQPLEGFSSKQYLQYQCRLLHSQWSKPLWLNTPIMQYIVSTSLTYLNQKGNPCKTLLFD